MNINSKKLAMHEKDGFTLVRLLRFNRRSCQGFTLVELLIVIVIIAVLSTIGMTIYGSAQKSARDAKRRSDLKAIAAALEQYKVVNTTYPKTPASTVCSNDSAAANPWIPDLNSNYIVSVPVDPINGSGSSHGGTGYSYCYYSGSSPTDPNSGTFFMLTTRMESPNSADRTSKCTNVQGTWGSSDSGTTGGYRYPDNLFVCNQQ